MITKEKITETLKAYTKKHNIAASSVILEEYAEELVKNDVIEIVRCKDCKYWNKQGFDPVFDVDFGDCKYGHLEDEFHSQTDENDFCSNGERKTVQTMTNYDRIKAMSVEEMAAATLSKFPYGEGCEKFCAYTKNGYCNKFADDGQGDCVDGIKQWLESEVSE